MALYVTKFGGTSLADAQCFRHSAGIIRDLVQQGHKVVVVVSAMAGETDRLVTLAQTFKRQDQSQAAFDVLVSSGEQASSGLMAMALSELNVPATPFQGWQLPILTSHHHTKAHINHMNTSPLHTAIDHGHVAIVSGFQGVTSSGAITTFGRGGSDVTAVLIAATLKADECRLYKDVDGLLSADPKIVESPVILDHIGISDVLEQCSQGAKIIHPRAVQAALAHDVPLRITPTFDTHNSPGTLIVPDQETLESSSISGIVCNDNETRFVVPITDTGTGLLTQIFSDLATHNIAMDMVLCDDTPHHSRDTKTLTFTVPKQDVTQTLSVLKALLPPVTFDTIQHQNRIAKIAVIGSGVKTHTHVLAAVYDIVNRLGIVTYGLTASERKINILVAQDYAKDCINALHNHFFASSSDRNLNTSQTHAKDTP